MIIYFRLRCTYTTVWATSTRTIVATYPRATTINSSAAPSLVWAAIVHHMIRSTRACSMHRAERSPTQSSMVSFLIWLLQKSTNLNFLIKKLKEFSFLCLNIRFLSLKRFLKMKNVYFINLLKVCIVICTFTVENFTSCLVKFW